MLVSAVSSAATPVPQPKRLTLAVDLDGTLAEWDRKWREPGETNKPGKWIDRDEHGYVGAQEAVARMLYDDCIVIVHSCRATWTAGGGAPAIAEFLRAGGFVPVEIVGFEEEGVHQDSLASEKGQVGIWVGKGKPVAHWYIDDFGAHYSIEEGWGPILGFLSKVAA